MTACQHTSAQVALECIEAYAEGRVNRRVLAGSPAVTGPWNVGPDGVQRRRVGFPAGDRFVLDLWERNDYGTARWRVVVARAGWPGEAVELLPAVRPGAVILADIQGAQRVRAFLAWLRQKGDRIERFSDAELARIELHFLRAPLARLRASSKGFRHAK